MGLLTLLAASAAAGGAIPADFEWEASSLTVPAGFTYSRNSTATVRDASGALQLSAANAPRWNHDPDGTFRGLLVEQQRANLFEQWNAAPTDATGFTATGTATVGLAGDAAALAAGACKLGAVVTGPVFEASGGASGGTVVWPGATGSTSNCSFSCWARITAGVSCTLTHTGTAPGGVTVAGPDYRRVLLQNQPISAATVQPLLDLPAGVTVRFTLCQTEVGANCSSVIRTQGAGATRASDALSDLTLAAEPWWDLAEGTIVVDVDYEDTAATPDTAPFFFGAGGQNFTNCIAHTTQPMATRRKGVSRVSVGATQQFTGDVGTVDAALQRIPFAASWVNGSAVTAAVGAANHETYPFQAGSVAGVDRLYLGGRATSHFLFGHLKAVRFYKRALTVPQLGRVMVRAGERVVATCGQSNMVGWFSATGGANNDGEVAAKAVYDQFHPATRNWLANGGTNGTSVKYYPATSTAANWWLNTDTGELGAPFQRFLAVAQGLRNAACDGIVDTSGESDAGNCTKAEFKAAQLQKWGLMRGVLGPVPVVVVPIGRLATAQDGYQTVREAQWELAAETAWVHLAPERFHLALHDNIHMTAASYATTGRWAMRKLMGVLGQAVAGGVDGPRFGQPTRTGTTVDVPVVHDGGTDFTTGATNTGFRYFSGADMAAAENVITTCARVNATLLRLTLTAAAAGTLYFGAGSTSTVTQANVPRDTSAEQLPFRTGRWAVA